MQVGGRLASSWATSSTRLLDGSEAGFFITLSFVHASLLHSLYYGVTGLL
jgi:hypothetical protein